MDEIELILVYAAVDQENYVFKKRTMTWTEIDQFMVQTCNKYISRMVNLLEWADIRNKAISKSKFPFKGLRQGQARMMRQVLAAISDKDALIVQAPTGIGKTMACLYPALKSLTVGYVKKIFYATNMAATREVAATSLEILREKGFLVRSIILQAKEKICCQPDLFCDQNICPYAVDYYKRLPDAIEKLLPLQNVKPEDISRVALETEVCPHELSLDFTDFCDVVIGDYNHIFDPQAAINKLFMDESESCALLIDEAHNLPSRARMMYSGSFNQAGLNLLIKTLKQAPQEFAYQYSQLLYQAELLASQFSEFMDSFRSKGRPQATIFFSNTTLDWLLADNFMGVRAKPDLLLNSVHRLSGLLKDFLDEQRVFDGRKEVLDFWFDLVFFCKLADYYYNEAYITVFKHDPKQGHACYLLSLDAAKYLTKTYKSHHPAIFFSATLSPMNYYHSLLNYDYKNFPAELLSLASPFDQDNRLLAALTAYSVRYKDRESTLRPIAEFVDQASSFRTGNYLIFVPSYKYLAEIKSLIEKNFKNSGKDYLFQTRHMTQLQKQEFLARFDHYGQKSLLAFAVLGSHFNEGVDLEGEKLSGVFVIGMGLPNPSPERDLMAEYYARKFEYGRAYAYQYPGFNRVQQAVGRLIRSESDIGFAILIDDRYANPDWSRIYPSDWQVKNFNQAQDLCQEIELFWQDRGLVD